MLYDSALGAKEIATYITKNKGEIDRVYIFNGRTASSYPIARECYDHDVPMAYYEYASSPYSGYRLYPYVPHSTKRLGYDIISFSRSSIKSIPEMYLAGLKWRQNKLNNPYVSRLKEKSKLKYDVVVFLGSDHEYTCIDEDISGFKYIGNLGLVKAVIDKYAKNYAIAVRAHPNQINDKNWRFTLKELTELCKENNVDFISPQSNISSYDLINNTKIVAIEYSSIAYDAIFLGKKVDIFGELDLKEFLSQVPVAYLEDSEYISSYVSEAMALYDDLFYIPFKKTEKFLCLVMVFFESRILKCSVPLNCYDCVELCELM